MKSALKNLNKLQIFAVITFTTLLAGCANLNSQFDCPMKPGVTCKSIDEINVMVDRGELIQKTKSTSPINIENVTAPNLNSPYPIQAINPGEPLRYGETVMRVWLAPYEDDKGNFYQPSVFYTVIKPGHWIGSPVKAVNNND